MHWRLGSLLPVAALAAMALALVFGTTAPERATAAPVAQGDKEKGAYLARLGGCVGCHGQNFAGQRADGTPGAPFGIALANGTVPSRNISPDSETGIGRWSDQDLMRSIRDGIRPDGSVLSPIMPYNRYHAIPDDEMLHLIAFLRSNPPVNNVPPARRLQQEPARPQFAAPSPQSSPGEGAARGQLLVSVANCANCHTPRLPSGQLDTAKNLAGNILPPRSQLNPGSDPEVVANITPDVDTGIGDWSADQIARALTTGRRPNNTEVKGAMANIVRTTYRLLSDSDARSISLHLKSIPAVNYRAEMAVTAAPAPAAATPAAPAAPAALPRTGDIGAPTLAMLLAGFGMLLAGSAVTLRRRRQRA